MYNRQDIKCVATLLEPMAKAGAISDPDAIVKALQRGLEPDSDDCEVFMTKAEVMDFYGIKEPTYYDWLRRKWLKPYGQGRKVMFKRSEVIAARRKPAGTQGKKS